MAERLMALVLKVQREPKKLDKSKRTPMLDIGFFVLDVLLMAEMSEKAAIGYTKNRMARNMAKANSDGKIKVGWQISINRMINVRDEIFHVFTRLTWAQFPPKTQANAIP